MRAKKEGISEKQVVEAWQRLLRDGTGLVTGDGERIRIIYPGRTNDDRGADFRDAVIASGEGLARGDIEVHVRTSDWQAHHHSRDPTYNRVILHVAMWDDAGGTTSLQNGKNVPVLALDSFIRSPDGEWQNSDCVGIPCSQGGHAAEAVAACLDGAGEVRFLARTERFQEEMCCIEAGQALYQGIMEALGYSRNKLPCLELARSLPLKALESIAREESSDEECLARLQALLLGTAGLLPSQRPARLLRPDVRVQKLERLWISSRRTAAMPYAAWSLFKVRPNNYPIRRIAGMSHLILRYREKGLLEGLLDAVREAQGKETHLHLEAALTVNADGYWSNHFDFGLCVKERSPLIGEGRAAVMAVNAVLPFTCAWSRLNSCPYLSVPCG